MFNRKNKTISKQRKRTNQNPGVRIVFAFIMFYTGLPQKNIRAQRGNAVNLECVKNKMAAIRHHTFELRQEERSGTDRLRAPYARDRFPPPTRSSDALLFTGSLVVRVCVSVGVEGGFKGSFCTITSRS